MITQHRIGRFVPRSADAAGRIRLQVDSGTLEPGDPIHVDGRGFAIEDRVRAIFIDGEKVEQAHAGDIVEVLLHHRIYDDAQVYIERPRMEADTGNSASGAARIPPAPKVRPDAPPHQTAWASTQDRIGSW